MCTTPKCQCNSDFKKETFLESYFQDEILAKSKTEEKFSTIPHYIKSKKYHRKNKKLRPGLTAKKRKRMFVVHNYTDYAYVSNKRFENNDRSAKVEEILPKKTKKQQCANTFMAFPQKLHHILCQVEKNDQTSIISWQPHGRAFVVHDKETFTEKIMSKYFRQTKFTSFQRQLNMYGFVRLTRGQDNGAYYHEFFFKRQSFFDQKNTSFEVQRDGFQSCM